MKFEKRKNKRIIFSVPVQYKVDQLENLEKDIREQSLDFKAEIQDFSLGGIQVVSGRTFCAGDILELELNVPEPVLVRTVAKVIWSRLTDPTKAMEYYSGIQFMPVNEMDLEKSKEYFRAGA